MLSQGGVAVQITYNGKLCQHMMGLKARGVNQYIDLDLAPVVIDNVPVHLQASKPFVCKCT